ncbi:MAG: hypothetical protein IJ454_01630, partial [Clostridia bacterium]|nr:hypothetical protein [Clostridia bacterium]
TDGVLTLIHGKSANASETDDAVIKASLSLNVPSDGKTYVVKAFLWDDAYKPAIKSITLR